MYQRGCLVNVRDSTPQLQQPYEPLATTISWRDCVILADSPLCLCLHTSLCHVVRAYMNSCCKALHCPVRLSKPSSCAALAFSRTFCDAPFAPWVPPSPSWSSSKASSGSQKSRTLLPMTRTGRMYMLPRGLNARFADGCSSGSFPSR